MLHAHSFQVSIPQQSSQFVPSLRVRLDVYGFERRFLILLMMLHQRDYFVNVQYLPLLPLHVVYRAESVRTPWTLVPTTRVASTAIAAPIILRVSERDREDAGFPFLTVSVFHCLQIRVCGALFMKKRMKSEQEHFPVLLKGSCSRAFPPLGCDWRY